MTRINGAEHIHEAVNKGVGVILLSAHFTCLEISGRVLSLNIPPFLAVHRSNKNPLITAIYHSGRERSASKLIEKNDMKGMVRSLRNAVPVWYAPDQSYSGKQSALLPFFGVPAMVNTATSTLAKLGKAVVIPFFPPTSATGRLQPGYIARRWLTSPAVILKPMSCNITRYWKTTSGCARSSITGCTRSSRTGRHPCRTLTQTSMR